MLIAAFLLVSISLPLAYALSVYLTAININRIWPILLFAGLVCLWACLFWSVAQ